MSPESLSTPFKSNKRKPEVPKKPEALNPEKKEKSQEELRAILQERLLALKDPIRQGMDEYQKALNEDVFEDKDGEPEGLGEQRKQAMQKKLSDLMDRAKNMKTTLDSEEELPQFVESDPSQYLQFWQTTFRDFWSVTDKNILNKAGTKPELISPEQINYQTKSQDIDTTKFGEYTLNPETQNIDWETIPDNKIKVIDPTAEGITGKRYEVIQQIIQKYGSTHYFPGIEYWKYILENPAKAPDSLKDEKYHFFIGSIFRYSVGRWVVPYASWGGAVFLRHGYWLDSGWGSFERVVLLER